jgi:hypothetical protein
MTNRGAVVALSVGLCFVVALAVTASTTRLRVLASAWALILVVQLVMTARGHKHER